MTNDPTPIRRPCQSRPRPDDSMTRPSNPRSAASRGFAARLSDRGAGNGIRTRDPQLGRLMLCQLSYSRPEPFALSQPPRPVVERGGFEPPKAEPADLQSAPFDRSGTSPLPRARPCLSFDERHAPVAPQLVRLDLSSDLIGHRSDRPLCRETPQANGDPFRQLTSGLSRPDGAGEGI